MKRQEHTVCYNILNLQREFGECGGNCSISPVADVSRYPRGGFHKVLDALVKVGERFGVEYRYSSPISQVKVDPRTGRATGVQLESGETMNADVVLVNADLVYAYNKLLPPSAKAKSLSAKPASCASISFYCKYPISLRNMKLIIAFRVNGLDNTTA